MRWTKRVLLALIEEVTSSSEYESETKSNAGSVLLAQESQPTLLFLTPLSLPLPLPLLPYKISQLNYPTIIRQLQEQIVALTV